MISNRFENWIAGQYDANGRIFFNMNPMKQESIDLELRIKRYEISKFYYLTLVRDQMDHVNQ